MGFLPNSHLAFIEDRKLLEYILNETHPAGKHKAILFRNILGITLVNYNELKEKILINVKKYPAQKGRHDKYGTRYIVDFPWDDKEDILIRTAWIIREDEDFPRFITVFIL